MQMPEAMVQAQQDLQGEGMGDEDDTSGEDG